MRSPFEVVEPASGETPLVVEVPHAGLDVDAGSLATLVAPARSIGRDADLYVDELFSDAPSLGATLIAARMSRYVVDLNRGEGDYDGEAVVGGGRGPWARGLVWRLTTEGQRILAQRLTREELERRLDLVYRPYHEALERVLARKQARFGRVVLICAHSMPSAGRVGHRDEGVARADLVPGTRGRTTAGGALIDAVDALARSFGWSVRHDDPYRGGFTTAHHGRPAEGRHAIQIEFARRLYMDEGTLSRRPEAMARVREFCRVLLARLPAVEV